MSGAVIPVLPTSLALLLHLHILSYSRCKSSEYSTPTLFAPTRPLRDRTKTMEDIVAFLIEQIEGPDKCKLILNGTYPCLRVSDSVTFRMSASKYIESLRNSAIRSNTLARAPSTLSKAIRLTKQQHEPHRGTSPPQAGRVPAWWWSEVVIRRSLLEECSGNRIEKLLLALSTHAIFVKLLASSPPHPDNPKMFDDMIEILAKQPEEYSSLLSRSIEAHSCRMRYASQLNARASSLISLKSRLALAPQTDDSSRIDIGCLLHTRDTLRKEVLWAWKMAIEQDESRSISPEQVLDWFLTMSGIKAPKQTSEDILKMRIRETDTTENDSLNTTTHIIQPLPIAAAHHPANLCKLSSLPPFISLTEQFISSEELHQRKEHKFSSVPLQEWFDNTAEQQLCLEELLSQARRQGEYISSKLATFSENQVEGKPSRNDKLPFQFWTAEEFPADLKTSPFADEVLKKYQNDMNIPASSDEDEDESQIEEKFETDVLNFRESLSPKFPVPGTRNMPLYELCEEAPRVPDSHMPRLPSPLGFTMPRARRRSTMLVTPRNDRRSTLLPSIIAASAGRFDFEFLADLSLPDESIEPDELNFPLFASEGKPANNDDILYGEHSMTVRDILLCAGDGDDSFNIVAESDYIEEDGLDDISE